MAESNRISRQQLIEQCLTDINPCSLEPHDQKCWICHEVMLHAKQHDRDATAESQKLEFTDPSIPGTATDEMIQSTRGNEKPEDDIDGADLSAVKITCGHTFCKYCTSKWLSLSTTCPECRTTLFIAATTALEEWQENRESMIRITTTFIQDHSESTWLPALRLRDFVVRETSHDELPSASMWAIVIALRRAPWTMTNEWVKQFMDGLERTLIEDVDLPEYSRRDIQEFQRILALDLVNHAEEP